jgi:hypothetical protein
MATGSKSNPLSLCYDALVAYYIASPALATVLILFLIVVAFGVAGAIWESATGAYSEYKFNQLPPAEHLRIAREACNVQKPEDSICMNPSAATSHLNRVSPESPEYGEASKLIEMIRRQEQAAAERQRQIDTAQETERTRLANQTESESFQQMGRNVAGTAHDAYKCATSKAGVAIVSFDSGNFWWADDGRCAAEEQKKRNEQQAARDREQRQRDNDAQTSSYWPTTLRVETDMDSFWLNNEERACVTAPDEKGRVARVTCSSNGSHQDHSIPVKFWGGVDRNTVSDWKCRREADEFVCRAID